MYGMSGKYDGCLNVYEEMKALGAKPDKVIYHTLLDAMGRAKRPWQAKVIYDEMLSNGFSPNWVTYACLLRAYCRARYGQDALSIYREMKEKGLGLDLIVYNTLMAMCADVDFMDETIEFFDDMKKSGTCEPDSRTFSSMISIFSCCGMVAEAEKMLVEMSEAGFEANFYVLTSLMQCHGIAKRTDDVVKTFHRLLDLGNSLDDRCYGCLLNVMTLTPLEELYKLSVCVEKTNPKLGYVVRLVVGGKYPSEDLQYIHLKTSIPIEEHGRCVLTPFAFKALPQKLFLAMQYATSEMANGSYKVHHFNKGRLSTSSQP